MVNLHNKLGEWIRHSSSYDTNLKLSSYFWAEEHGLQGKGSSCSLSLGLYSDVYCVLQWTLGKYNYIYACLRIDLLLCVYSLPPLLHCAQGSCFSCPPLVLALAMSKIRKKCKRKSAANHSKGTFGYEIASYTFLALHLLSNLLPNEQKVCGFSVIFRHPVYFQDSISKMWETLVLPTCAGISRRLPLSNGHCRWLIISHRCLLFVLFNLNLHINQFFTLYQTRW